MEVGECYSLPILRENKVLSLLNVRELPSHVLYLQSLFMSGLLPFIISVSLYLTSASSVSFSNFDLLLNQDFTY